MSELDEKYPIKYELYRNEKVESFQRMIEEKMSEPSDKISRIKAAATEDDIFAAENDSLEDLKLDFGELRLEIFRLTAELEAEREKNRDLESRIARTDVLEVRTRQLREALNASSLTILSVVKEVQKYTETYADVLKSMCEDSPAPTENEEKE